MPYSTSQFQTEKLLPAHARQAYPLIHLANPEIAMTEWLAFVRRWSRLSLERGGIMTLKDRRGYIHAVYTYKIDYSIAIGRLLRISDIIFGNLPGQSLGDAILNSVNKLADRLHCPAIVLETPAWTDAETLTQEPRAPFGFLHHPAVSSPLKPH